MGQVEPNYVANYVKLYILGEDLCHFSRLLRCFRNIRIVFVEIFCGDEQRLKAFNFDNAASVNVAIYCWFAAAWTRERSTS